MRAEEDRFRHIATEEEQGLVAIIIFIIIVDVFLCNILCGTILLKGLRESVAAWARESGDLSFLDFHSDDYTHIHIQIIRMDVGRRNSSSFL